MPELRKSSRLQAHAKPENKSKEPPSKKSKTEGATKKEIREGDKIIDITLLNENDDEVNLSEETSSNKSVIVFAFPKASTPGCTKQACGFRDNFAALQKLNAKVFGISSDSPKAQKNFQTKEHLEYSLLSDPEKKLIGPLGARKSPSGITRSHWIFVDGILRVKKIGISPQESFESAKKDIESLTGEGEKQAPQTDSGVKSEQTEEKLEEKEEATEGEISEKKGQ